MTSNIKQVLLRSACSRFCLADSRRRVSKVWVADNGDGTYKNPIIHADYSDPDAIRVGDDYYMTASSFNAVPGLPILHSKDLVNWRLINHVFREQEPKRSLCQTAARRRRLGTVDTIFTPANFIFITRIPTSAFI